MAVPDTTSNDPLEAARAWLEEAAECHAAGKPASVAPPHVREVWVSIDPPPADDVPARPATPPTRLHPEKVRPRFIWEATLRDGRKVKVAREVTDQQMGLA